MSNLKPSSKSAGNWAAQCILLCFVLCLWIGVNDTSNRVTAQESAKNNSANLEDEIYDSEKRTAGLMTPEESLKALQLPEGFQASLFAAEPDIRQPIAATTDSRGRLWVCENYTYSESKINFDLKLSDRIVILEDKDNDGRAESRKVFWDKAKRLTSIAIGFDGVFATCAPNLIFIPDRNHDDIPDGPPEVLLDGWNDDAVRHNIVNGLMWGPDGWLYGRHGIMGTSFVGKPGDTASQRTPINCGIWRYHPLHRVFEVVAHGTTNPWGMDFNNEGDLFMINTVIGHLWHVVPGARYDRMYGSHFNPYTYQTIPQTADHYHWNKSGGEAWHETKKTGLTAETDRFGGGHAHCGLLLYVDESWPAKYRDTILTCNLHGLRINNDHLVPKGNGFVGKHNPDFAKTTDTWFRGIELVRSHDEGFYLLDWQDTGECHENDGVHRSSGRIYKITYGNPKVKRRDISKLDWMELKALLELDRWHVLQAITEIRTRLARKGSDLKVIDKLVDLKNTSPGHSFLRRTLASDHGGNRIYARAYLSLRMRLSLDKKPGAGLQMDFREVMNSLANEIAIYQFDKKEEQNSRRLKSVSNELYSLAMIWARKSTPRTRLTIASVLNRLKTYERLRVAKELLRFREDKDDNMMPLLLFYAIEPLAEKMPQQVADVGLESEIPLFTELIARRLAEKIDDPAFEQQVVHMVSDSESTVKLTWVLKGIAQALKGRKKVAKPKKWDLALSDVKLDDKQLKLNNEIQIAFGDGKTLDAIRKIAKDKNADPRMRGQAILTLAESGDENLINLLNQNLGDRDVRQYVIEAYAFCDDPSIAKRIVNQFNKLKPAGKLAAINTLTKREPWATSLLNAIQSKRIPKKYLTAWHARQIANQGKPELTALLEKVWGAVRQTPAAKLKELEDLKLMMSQSSSDTDSLKNGQEIFSKSCANCHVLFGTGGKIGPDLTGSNRKDLGYLLENILDPSSSVADTFRTSIVGLVDGRTITGVILKETQTTVEIQTTEKVVRLERNEIEKIKKTDQSLMPEGLLKDFTDDQKRDLLLYLMN